MKMKLIQRTNIESALKNKRSSTYEEHNANLENFIGNLNINIINNFDFNKLPKTRIYHIDHIKKVCIDYRLRFLDIKYFKNKLPIEALNKIKKLEKNHKTKLSEFKINFEGFESDINGKEVDINFSHLNMILDKH